jgi:methylated-DNA-[protein]-cysteine S-methyltransferase
LNKETRIAELLNGSADPGEASRRFAQRALDEGLVDVAYDTLDSPLGPILAAVTPTGLVRLSYHRHRPEDEVLEQLASRLSPRVLHAPRKIEPIRRQLGEYFEGRRREFELDTDWSLISPFARKVLGRTVAIPYGSISTYSEVAAAAGSPRGARAAGNALGSNPIPIVIPCHRVLRRGNALGGYTGGIELKAELLKLEGAAVTLV